ncbi:MAG: SurA N-terminal domain-containing protein, partial [Clostridia bacterium]|nr:SurA N-terminal domain-containing protein [Clostridia bacterium]
MRKKSVLALLLALMMILSGCALVTKDEEKDNARVIIDVNGETVDKRTVSAAVQNQISQNEYYNQLFSSYYGYSDHYPTDEATVTDQVVEAYTQNLVLKQKAYAMGMDQMNDEEAAHVEEHAKEYYESFLQSVISAYLPNSGLEGDELNAAAEKYVAENDVATADGRSTYDDFFQAALEEVAVEKLEEDIVKDVAVTEEEIKADFDAKVEAAKEQMEADPDLYGYNVMNGSAVYYAPAGYRMVKHILITVSDEDQAVITEAQNALDAAAEDADKDALQAAVDAAQAAGMANAKAKADEVYALATAEGA